MKIPPIKSVKEVSVLKRNWGSINLSPKIKTNTPETRVGPGFRDRKLAVKNRKNTENHFFWKFRIKKKRFLYIPSCYAKI